MAMKLFWGGMKNDMKQVRRFIENEIAQRLDEFSELAKDDDYWHIIRKILEEGGNPGFAKEVMHRILLLIEQEKVLLYLLCLNQILKVLKNMHREQLQTLQEM